MSRMKGWSKRWIRSGMSALGASLVGVIAAHTMPLRAMQLSDGTTVFDSPPRLEGFITTRDRAGDRRATYYVTVNVLPEAGESLETLRIELIEGRFRLLDYRLNEIEVFAGDRGNRGESFEVAVTDYDDTAQTLTIRLAEAIAPGQHVTFAVSPVRNPTQAGVYLFEVTAALAGEQPMYQRIGTGRLNIFRSDGRDPYYGR